MRASRFVSGCTFAGRRGRRRSRGGPAAPGDTREESRLVSESDCPLTSAGLRECGRCIHGGGYGAEPRCGSMIVGFGSQGRRHCIRPTLGWDAESRWDSGDFSSPLGYEGQAWSMAAHWLADRDPAFATFYAGDYEG